MSTVDKHKKDNRIVVIQYICTILIVILHSSNIKSWQLSEKADFIWIVTFESIVYHVCQIAVPTFFFFTGYLFFHSFTPKNFASKLHKRVYTLAIPYLIWNTVATLCFFALTNLSIFSQYMNQDKVDLSWRLFLDILNSTYSPLWYIRNIMVLSMLAMPIYCLLKNKYICIMTIVLLIAINCAHPFDYYGIIYWLPEYLIGGYISLYGVTFLRHFSLSVKKCSVIGICACVLLLCTVSSYIYQPTSHIIMFLFRIVASISVPFILGSAISVNTKVTPFMKCTLFIYCTHFLVISSFQKILKLLLPRIPISAFVCYAVTPFFVLMFLYVIAKYWKLHFPKSWNIVQGGLG